MKSTNNGRTKFNSDANLTPPDQQRSPKTQVPGDASEATAPNTALQQEQAHTRDEAIKHSRDESGKGKLEAPHPPDGSFQQKKLVEERPGGAEEKRGDPR